MTIEMKSSILGKIVTDLDNRLLYVEKATLDGGPLLMSLPDEPSQ